jgi:hypothetical protein
MFKAVYIELLKECGDIFKEMIKCDKDRQKKMEHCKLNQPEDYERQRNIVNAEHRANMDNLRHRRFLLSGLSRKMTKMEIMILTKEFEDRNKIHALDIDNGKKIVLFAQFKEHYLSEKRAIAGHCMAQFTGHCMDGDVFIANQRAIAISPAARLLPRSRALYRRSRYRSRSRSRSRSRHKSGV